jgi:hypothetical protein
MRSWGANKGLKEARKERCTAPIVDDSDSLGNVIEVRSDDNDFRSAARKDADNVRLLPMRYWLLSEVRGLASSFGEEF